MYIIYGLMICIFFVACNNQKDFKNDVDIRILDYLDPIQIEFQDMFQIDQVISLETIDQSLIKQVAKLEITDEKFHLFNTDIDDPVFKEIIVFNKDGSFSNSLKGGISGVLDFRYATDFQINEGSYLFLEGVLKRILEEKNGIIQNVISIHSDGKKFIINDEKIWVYRDNSFKYSNINQDDIKSYNLIIHDISGNVKKSLVKIPENIRDLHVNTGKIFFKNLDQSSIFFFPTFSDTIYDLSNEGIVREKYLIGGNDHFKLTVPSRFDPLKSKDILQLLNDPDFCADKYIVKKDNTMIIFIQTLQKLHIITYNELTKASKSFIIEKTNFIGSHWAYSNGILYILFNSALNNSMIANLDIDMPSSIDVNSNPIILNLRIKKDFYK